MTGASFLDSHIKSYAEYRSASGRKSRSYMKNIRFFEQFCLREYPSATALTQEMVDRWCAQRSTETTNSCVTRIYGVVSFLRFLRARGVCHVELPAIPRSRRRAYVPHAFSGDELKRFFMACDTMRYRNGTAHAIQRLSIPVFFRLLYSSGIRTTEAIALRTSDVDLDNGVLFIREGKGYGEHMVALHDSMTQLMRLYDTHMERMMPSRKIFFPTPDDRAHPPVWVTYHFHALWHSCNTSHATPYELRHNYAVENINSWTGVGFGLHDRLLALSKSMGHRDLRSTMGYYHLTPSLADHVLLADEGLYEDLITEEDI